MKLSARLKKLEVKMGMGRRCAYCRLALRETPDGSAHKPEELRVWRTCTECGSTYSESLAKHPERIREAYLLLAEYSEDAPFTDPRAHALQLWLLCKLHWIDASQRKASAQREAARRSKARRSKAAKFYAEIFEQAVQLRDVQQQRKFAQYGRRFPEQDELLRGLASYYGQDKERKMADVLSQLETIIWGEPLPETIAELVRFEQEKQEKLAAEAQRQEEWRRRNEEYLERNRQVLAQNQPRAW